MNEYLLELKEYKNYNEDLLLIRKKIIEQKLSLKNINYTIKKNIIKGYYIYLYYHKSSPILINKEKLDEILIDINKLENDDKFFSNSEELTIFNKYINNIKDDNLKDISSIKIYRKDLSFPALPLERDNNNNIKIIEDFDNKYLSKNHHRIKLFLNISPFTSTKIFKYNDIYEKEMLKNIDKNKLPLYKLMKENKFALLDVLKSHPINFSPNDINYFLINDRLPFINYKDLQDNLKEYYKMEKFDYFKISKKEEEEACLYLLGKNEIIMLEDLEGYHIYSRDIHISNVNEMRNKYMEKFDSIIENKYDINLEIMTNKEILNMEFHNNKAFINYDNEIINPFSKDLIDQNKKDNYHRGFYHNGLYKSYTNNLNNNKKFKIKNKIKIEFLLEDSDYYTILITPNLKEVINFKLEINNFYIPDNKEFILQSSIEKLWELGYFLTSFGKAVENNENIILNEELIIPTWFISNDLNEFDNLIRHISLL